MNTAFLLARVTVIAVALGAVFYYVNKRLGSYFGQRPHLKFRYELIQIAGALLAILFVYRSKYRRATKAREDLEDLTIELAKKSGLLPASSCSATEFLAKHHRRRGLQPATA